MSRPFWIVVAIALLATAIYYPFSPGGSQRANMKRAEQHITVLKPQIASDARYRDVEFVSYTGEGGSLAVFGDVQTQADRDSLEALVRQSQPPCLIAFRVRVVSSAATQASVH